MNREERFQKHEKKTYLCIDFDSTIVDHEFPAIGKPVPGAIRGMKEFIALGAKIILFTIRDGEHLRAAIHYLWENGIKIWAINDNPDQHCWSSSRKVYAHRYIDDLAAGTPLVKVKGFYRPCVDWSKITPEVIDFIKSR